MKQRFRDWVENTVERNVRASYLVAAGVMHVVIGLGWVFTDSAGRIRGLEWIPGILPPAIGVAWVIGGMIALTTGLASEKIPEVEKYGFAANIFMPLVCSMYFLVAWALYIVPVFDGGSETGILSTSSYATMAIGAGFMSRVQRGEFVYRDELRDRDEQDRGN